MSGRAGAHPSRPCRGHPERDAVVRCVGCGDDLCGECHRFTIDDAPGCARCAYEASTRRARRLSLAAVFLGLGTGLGAWLTVRFELGEELGALVVGALFLLGVSAGIAWSGLSQAPARVVLRDEDEAPPRVVFEEPSGGASYRAAARRVVQAVSPRLSARAT
ncbi:MAG: hypothetical protein IT374_13950, partial [Polyangiaceae bacterium]|nr:hypothetical protein [Polyangiaceae bacterium]